MQRLLFIAPETPVETLLAAGMLAIAAEKLAPRSTTIICPEALAPFYKNMPFPSETLTYIPDECADPLRLLHRLADAPAPDLCINARTTRDPFSDAIALNCRAAQTVGHAHPFGSPQSAADDAAPHRYSRLAPHSGVVKLETQRHRDLLKALDIDVESVPPAIWTTPADRAWADALLHHHQLDPARTLILFPEPSHPLATWHGFPQGLVPPCRTAGLSIIAVGQSTRENDTAQLQAITASGIKVLDLRGQISFFQTAELMHSVRAAVGLENIFAHIACAVGCRNAVLLAGGTFGRWFPYSPLTAGITEPLHCLGCNWKCRYESPYCAAAVAPFMFQVALHDILNSPEAPKLPRLFVQHSDFGLAGPAYEGKIPFNDCYLNPDALPSLLYEIYHISTSNTPIFGMPTSLYGCKFHRVCVQVHPAGATP